MPAVKRREQDRRRDRARLERSGWNTSASAVASSSAGSRIATIPTHARWNVELDQRTAAARAVEKLADRR